MNRKGRPALLPQKWHQRRGWARAAGAMGPAHATDCGGHPPLLARGKPSPAPSPPPDCPTTASRCLAHAAWTPPCYCILAGCLHLLAASRWEKDLCFHCINPCLHLTNHIRTWERRCISGQQVQCRGSHGLRLTMMPGRSLITFHFCGSVVEQDNRWKTGLSWSIYKRPFKPNKTGWV